MPRKSLADRGTQTSVRLPRALYDRLAAEAGDQGIGEEIRRRLDASFAAQPTDPETRQLVEAISAMAQWASISGSLKWHESLWGFEMFRRAIDNLLHALKPEGTPFERASRSGGARAELESFINEGAATLAGAGAAKIPGHPLRLYAGLLGEERVKAFLAERQQKDEKP